MSWLAIVGNTPELSALELERLYGNVDWAGANVAILQTQPDLTKLGGTIKIAEQILNLPRSLDGLDAIKLILEKLASTTNLRFGFSIYAGERSITEQVVQHYAKRLRPLGI